QHPRPMRIPDRLHDDPDAAGQAGRLRGSRRPGARRLAVTRAGIAAAGFLLLALAPSARAHSLLLESAPAADAQLAAPRLVDERGGVRPVTMLANGPADRLTASVPSLDPGAWRVEWRVLSTDGHVVSGRFSFRVAR